MAQRICSVEGCPETHKGHGYCRNHLRRWKKHGDPNLGRAAPQAWTEAERRERARQRASDWYSANRERALANVKSYRETNPEKIRKLNREYRAANREQIDQRVKDWNVANRGRRRQIARKYTNARRGLAIPAVPFTQEQWEAKVAYWGDRCWICGGDWSDMDHVKPISAGGADMLCNLRPACGSCNSTKNAKWPYPVEKRQFPQYKPFRKGNK